MTSRLDAIDELRALLEEATAGPWKWRWTEGDPGWTAHGPDLLTADDDDYDLVISAWGHEAWGIDVERADADLIVALRNHAEALLELWEAARGHVSALDQGLDLLAEGEWDHVVDALDRLEAIK